MKQDLLVCGSSESFTKPHFFAENTLLHGYHHIRRQSSLADKEAELLTEGEGGCSPNENQTN